MTTPTKQTGGAARSSRKRVPLRRAAIYCRISQDRTGQRAGVERQERECRKLCNREGLDVVRVFEDNDISAYSGKPRPDFAEMLELIRLGGAEVIVAWHPDRLTRQPRELEDVIDFVNGAGVDVMTVTAGDYDLSTATSRGIARIVGGIARMESEQKSERLKAQRDQAARNGVPTGGPRPFGYEASTGRPGEPGYERGGLKVNRREAKLVKELVARLIDGDSIRTIAYDWNRRKVVMPKGGAVQMSSLRGIVRSGRIAGKRTHRGEIVGDAAWPALVSVADWQHANAVLDAKGKPGRAPQSLLGGLVRCGRCGGPMHHTTRRQPNGRISGRYLCDVRPGSEACGRVTIAGEPLEEAVSEEVLAWFDPKRLAKIARGAEDTSSAVIAQVERLRHELDELGTLRGDGTISTREWLAAREPLHQRLDAAREALGVAHHRTPAPVAHLLDETDLEGSWEQLDTESQRKILAALVEKVVIQPQRAVSGRRFDRERIDIVPRV